MRISDRTIWDIPVSSQEFVLALVIGGLMLATILLGLRPLLRAVLGIEAGL
jgi:hypothetical protein